MSFYHNLHKSISSTVDHTKANRLIFSHRDASFINAVGQKNITKNTVGLLERSITWIVGKGDIYLISIIKF